MTTEAPAPATAELRGEPAPSYLQEPRGLWSWLTTLDHKRIGILYLISVTAALFVGGLFAMLIRLELISPELSFFSSTLAYNQAFTLHGAIMVFMFVIPGIPAALGNFVLPLMLGAQDVALPRLNLASWYFWLAGSALMIGAILAGGIDTGWTFYIPYSSTYSREGDAVLLALGGVFILGFSSIFTGLNFVVTMHKLRCRGMGWFRMPLFLWAIYATALLQIVATPVLGITLALAMVERAFGVGIFRPELGGDPVLFQHFFWFYSHPAVYIMILPAMGVISELIAVHSHKKIFGYRAIAFSSLAIALISFLVWGHHMFTSGQSQVAGAVFSFLTFLVAIPTAIKAVNWVATLYKGQIALRTPMLYALGFLFVFIVGGLTGIFLATVSINLHLHDTYFVVAHFHYVMVGGTVMAFLGGLHHWWPKMFGRMYNERAAKLGWLLVVGGFIWTFLPQFIMGSRGMPRRYATYNMEGLEVHQPLHLMSSLGAWVIGAGMVWTLCYLVYSIFKGRRAEVNPWRAVSLEWDVPSPPATHNFPIDPHVDFGPYDFERIDEATGLIRPGPESQRLLAAAAVKTLPPGAEEENSG
ncbi:MAG: cytochrome c oxidase subunit I [Planctomycetota bacterium]|nr:MAG: cytochrome c oxidase subunit I [Planctomycetota bacterium]